MPEHTESDPLLKVADVAKRWAVSKRAVWRYIEKGAIDAVRVGPFGAIRIRESVAVRFFVEQSSPRVQ